MKDFDCKDSVPGGDVSSKIGDRLSAEFTHVDAVLDQYEVKSTVTVFGSARIKAKADIDNEISRAALNRSQGAKLLALAPYYEDARIFAKMTAGSGKADGRSSYIATGGGPGIMEAANRGAFDAGADSIGFGIELPFESGNNSFVSPHLSFEFKYFLIRKFHLMKRAKCLVVFPGGIGSIDEMAEAITLRQTGKTDDFPIILYGREFWKRALDLNYLVDCGTMSSSDLDLIHYADTPEEALRLVP